MVKAYKNVKAALTVSITRFFEVKRGQTLSDMIGKRTAISLRQILNLVGKLDDSAGVETPRERFRVFLRDNVQEVGQIRDYTEECLRLSGDQYNRALQDLVNHLGSLLGFEVQFGRYHGIRGKIGFDGYWKSPSGAHIVVEAKTTETYAIRTATLVGYVDDLISEKKIPAWDNAYGLYVVGRPDPEVNQLENAIIAERRTNKLRIISVESLLSLAEMMNEYEVNHEDILAILLPSSPRVDPVVELIARVVAQSPLEELPIEVEPPIEAGEPKYWLTPVKSEAEATAEQVIQTLVGQEKIYAFGERTPGRKRLKPGDWLCFHASGKGVIAHAKVMSRPEKKPHPKVQHKDKYPWTFRVGEAKLYLNDPVIIDAEVRANLEVFRNRDLNKSWGWFVQATRKIDLNDFNILTRRS